MNTKNSIVSRTWSDALSAAKLTDVVQGIINCYLNKQNQGILDRLDENVVWNLAGDPEVVPVAGCHTGKQAVSDILHLLNSTITVKTLQSGDFVIEGNSVEHQLYVEGFVLLTGRPFVFKGSIHWTIAASLMVLRMEQTGDTASLEAAFRI